MLFQSGESLSEPGPCGTGAALELAAGQQGRARARGRRGRRCRRGGSAGPRLPRWSGRGAERGTAAGAAGGRGGTAAAEGRRAAACRSDGSRGRGGRAGCPGLHPTGLHPCGSPLAAGAVGTGTNWGQARAGAAPGAASGTAPQQGSPRGSRPWAPGSRGVGIRKLVPPS